MAVSGMAGALEDVADFLRPNFWQVVGIVLPDLIVCRHRIQQAGRAPERIILTQLGFVE